MTDDETSRRGRPLRDMALATLVGIGLATLFLGQAAVVRRATSATFDETFFLSCALQGVHDGRLDPRLSREGVAPLPILLEWLVPAWLAPRQERSDPWEAKLADPEIVERARALSACLIGVPLLLMVFVWMLCRRGLAAATLAGCLVACSPSIVAHASIATTDACFVLFSLVALSTLIAYRRRPAWWRLVIAALGVSLAVSAKYSGVFLIPVSGLLLLKDEFFSNVSRGSRRWRGALWRASKKCALLWLLAIPIIWGLHGFAFTGPLKRFPLAQTTDDSPWIRLLGKGPTARRIMEFAHEHVQRPAPLDGLVFQYLHNARGHGGYLFGSRSPTGWWYYFPSALAVKSTPVEWLLFGVLLFAAANRVRRGARHPAADVTLETWGVSMIVFLVLACCSRINIGQRYVIVLYPLLIAAAVDLLWSWWSERRARRLAVGMTLGLLQMVGALLTVPDDLAYFNPLVGADRASRPFLLDSNLDWGQDLPRLKSQLVRLGYQRVALSYFGTAKPESYGLMLDDGSSNMNGIEAVCVSANHLHGLYGPGETAFAELGKIPPTAHAGRSITIFALDSPRARHACQVMARVLGDKLKIYQVRDSHRTRAKARARSVRTSGDTGFRARNTPHGVGPMLREQPAMEIRQISETRRQRQPMGQRRLLALRASE